MINVKVEGELLNYGYLQVPQCNVCGAFISKCSQIRKDSWVCQVCKRQLKLCNWYREQPIQLDEFQIVQTAPELIRRAVFLVDVSSRILCQMIIPLIESSNFDEIAIIACTPYPTVIEIKNKIKMITLLDDQDYKLDIFMNWVCAECWKNYANRMFQKQIILQKSRNNFQIDYWIINKLKSYILVGQHNFQGLNNRGQLILEKIIITYLLLMNLILSMIIIKNRQGDFMENVKYLLAMIVLYLIILVDKFYERIENVFSGQFCWEAQLSVILGPGVKVEKFQEYQVESNIFYLPYLSNTDEIQMQLSFESQSKSTIVRGQTILSYHTGDRRIIAIRNLIL